MALDIAVADPKILQSVGPKAEKAPGPEDIALMQERLAKAQETRQKLIDDAKNRAILSTAYQHSLDEKGQVDPDKLYTNLAPYPELYDKAQTHFADIRTKAATAAHTEADTNEKDAGLLAQLAQGVGDDGAGYDYFRQRAVAIDPRADKFLAPTFDPTTSPTQVAFLRKAGTGVSEQNKIEAENRKLLLGGDVPTAAGRLLGSIKGPDPQKNDAAWQQNLSQMRILTLGVPGAKATIDALPQHWSPEAADQVNAQAQTSEQRAQAAAAKTVHEDVAKNQQRDDDRAAAAEKSLADYRALSLGERAKHDRAMENKPTGAGSTAAPASADTIQGYVDQIKTGNMFLANVPGNRRDAVVNALRQGGVDVQKLTAADLTRRNVAKTIEPKIASVQQMAREIDKMGLTGTLGGRWRKLLAGETAASDISGLTPAQKQLVGKFASEASGLLVSGIAMAHGGARGGGSPQLLAQIKEYLDPGTKDLNVYIGNLEGAKDFIHGYATMGESAPKTEKSAKDPLGIR